MRLGWKQPGPGVGKMKVFHLPQIRVVYMSKARQADSSLKFAVRKRQGKVGEGMEEKGRTILVLLENFKL